MKRAKIDGLWHYVDGARTVCGLPVVPQKAGRPGNVTCAGCADAPERIAPTPTFDVPRSLVLPGPTDPPVRADGRCAYKPCGKKRNLTKQARRYAGAQLDIDPFCSSKCCKAYHGVVHQPSLDGEPEPDDLELAAA